MNDKTACKHSVVPNLIVLRKEEMMPILEYVKLKYGKDFINLYDKLD